MGGRGSTDTQRGITQEDLDLQREQLAFAREDRAARDAATQPARSFYGGVTTDAKTATQASSDLIGRISGAYQTAIGSIFDTVGPGAGRNVALGQAERERAGATAGGINSIVLQAYDKLANIGMGLGSFALGETSAGANFQQQASAANQAVMQDETARKAAQLGFLGQGIGAAGSIIGGKLAGGSDQKLKKHIEPLGKVLHLLHKSPVVYFDYKKGPSNQIGVIAQELQLVFPGMVTRHPEGYLMVDYGQLAAVAIHAIRELSIKVDTLEKQLLAPQPEPRISTSPMATGTPRRPLKAIGKFLPSHKIPPLVPPVIERDSNA